MTINPADLPDGTVVEIDSSDGWRRGDPSVGYVANPHGVYTRRPGDGGQSIPGTIVRTFSPDPLPSQEVPRDQWANIKPGSRVRIEDIDGTVVVGESSLFSETWLDVGRDHTFAVDEVARVFVLDEPADPDADLARAIEDAVPDGSWDGKTTLANLRAAGFDVVKAGA